MITAKIIADSKNEYNNRITTMIVTMPRIILAEFNTHRMFSRNSASSRAIPSIKMIRSILENPFIPLAWQKDHKGMQGTEYFNNNEKFNMQELKEIMQERLIKLYEKEDGDDPEIMEMWDKVMNEFEQFGSYTLNEFWGLIRDKVVKAAILLFCLGVTKQIVNRLLEPFMWHTVIVTATEWQNFFTLRCPRYSRPVDYMDKSKVFYSWKDYTEYQKTVIAEDSQESMMDWFKNKATTIDKLESNKGQAEIHMMALAEAMWDAYNESVPKELEAGKWHIPFEDEIDMEELGRITADYYKQNRNEEVDPNKWLLKIATARCARISYTTVGEEEKRTNYTKDIELHDKLAASGHWSPFEHCAQAIESIEMYSEYASGQAGNFVGFNQYRKRFVNENIK